MAYDFGGQKVPCEPGDKKGGESQPDVIGFHGGQVEPVVMACLKDNQPPGNEKIQVEQDGSPFGE